MYCPQCATESSPDLQYCRVCGANLKVIGKAVALSEAIARSDRGPLPKIKEMFKGLKVEHVTEEVSRALEKMNNEIVRISPEASPSHRSGLLHRKKKTAEERREQHISKGTVSFFSGMGLTLFLYYLSAALALKLPPDWIARVPFEIEPVVRVIWLFGFIPMLSGMGHILAGLLIRPSPAPAIYQSPLPQENLRASSLPRDIPVNVPVSVTERTTNLLGQEALREDSTG